MHVYTQFSGQLLLQYTGYTLTGDMSRTCLHTGHWFGFEPNYTSEPIKFQVVLIIIIGNQEDTNNFASVAHLVLIVNHLAIN